MAKKDVNYERQVVRFRELWGEYYTDPGFNLKRFREIAETFADKHGISREDVNFHFEAVEGYYNSIEKELNLSGERPETEAEYTARVAKEEAKIALDKNNAIKSQKKKEEQERILYEKLKAKFEPNSK